MKKLKSIAIKLWKDESGQGTAEYVLILVAVVALAYMFGPKLKGIVSGKMENLQGKIGEFTGG